MPHINNAGTQVPANQRVGLTNNPGISVRTWVKNTTAPLPVQSAYFDSDSVTGPWLTNKTNAPSGVVQYQIKVFNTGTVTLSNIVVAVRNLSNIQVQRYTIAQISRGGSATLYYKPAFAQGQQVSACDGAAAFRSCCIALEYTASPQCGAHECVCRSGHQRSGICCLQRQDLDCQQQGSLPGHATPHCAVKVGAVWHPVDGEGLFLARPV